MPSQCQAAGGKSAFSVAAKGSLVSPNPSSLHVYVGMTVYIRIYECVPCVFVYHNADLFSFFDLRLPVTFFSKAWSRQVYLYNVHIDANLQSVLKRPLKAGHVVTANPDGFTKSLFIQS